MEITKELAEKVLHVVDHGLVAGLGQPIPGQMCVEAAVCYAMGLPHSDKPTCVDQHLSQFKISLNDMSFWSSKKARAIGLRRLAIAQLGTKDQLDINVFANSVREYLIKKVLPSVIPDELFSRMALSKSICENYAEEYSTPFTKAVKTDIEKLHASPNEWALLKSVDHLRETFSLAPYSVGYKICLLTAAICRVECHNTIPATKQEELAMSICEAIVQILVKMETPGSKFLYLTE